jgi:hypothetical protein
MVHKNSDEIDVVDIKQPPPPPTEGSPKVLDKVEKEVPEAAGSPAAPQMINFSKFF